MASEAIIIAEGDWYPPYSSGAVSARLVERDGNLFAVAAESGADLASGPARGVIFSPRVGSISRKATFGDGSVFETGDNDAVDGYLRQSRTRHASIVHRLERFHPRIFVFALAVILLGAGIYRYALPAVVEVAVLVTPPVVPEMISYGALSTLDKATFSPSKLSDAEKASIAAGFQKVAEHAGEIERFKLNFRDGGIIGPNAFALPDGNIVITDELVTLANGDEEMVTAVLAHEIGHVEYKHSLRQLYRAAGMAGLVMLIAGDIGSGVEDILTQGGGLLALSYSRAAEAQADQRSVELMGQAGLDPVALTRFFDVLENKLGDHGGTSMLSTHPGTPERKQAIIDYEKSRRGS